MIHFCDDERTAVKTPLPMFRQATVEDDDIDPMTPLPREETRQKTEADRKADRYKKARTNHPRRDKRDKRKKDDTQGHFDTSLPNKGSRRSLRRKFLKYLFDRDLPFSLRGRRRGNVKKKPSSDRLRRTKSFQEFIKRPFSTHFKDDDDDQELRRSQSFQSFRWTPFSPRKSATAPVEGPYESPAANFVASLLGQDHRRSTATSPVASPAPRKRSSIPRISIHIAKRPTRSERTATSTDETQPKGAGSRSLLASDTYDPDPLEITEERVRTPSSGFQSQDVPSTWGKVVQLRASSSYSRPSRPVSSVPTQYLRTSMEGRPSFQAQRPARPSGAWARYPSETRTLRNEMASTRDAVIARDFQTTPRLSSVPLHEPHSFRPRRYKQPLLHRSPSLAAAKTFLREYSNIFRPQNRDFVMHGHGHRSSVSAGGVLAEPELEMLPPVFAPFPLPRRQGSSGSAYSDGVLDERRRLEHGGDASTDLLNPVGGAQKKKTVEVPISAAELYAQWYVGECIEVESMY